MLVKFVAQSVEHFSTDSATRTIMLEHLQEELAVVRVLQDFRFKLVTTDCFDACLLARVLCLIGHLEFVVHKLRNQIRDLFFELREGHWIVRLELIRACRQRLVSLCWHELTRIENLLQGYFARRVYNHYVPKCVRLMLKVEVL